jgi:mannose-1-phosphate guanylyltransferase
MIKIFKEKKSSACIATRTKRKEETGFAVVENGIIKEFREKPTMKLQLSECLGIYILGKDVIKRIKAKAKQKEINLSFDILQQLSKEGKISAYDIEDKEWLDVESPMIVERNETTVKKIIKQMGF